MTLFGANPLCPGVRAGGLGARARAGVAPDRGDRDPPRRAHRPCLARRSRRPPWPIPWGGLVDLDDLQGVLTDTAFGAVWQGRLIVALALLVALAIGRHGSSIFMTAVSALLLASLCRVGHAAMQQGAVGALHRANHALHLLAAGAWIGGLPLFALCLRLSRSRPARDAARAMMRFSAWGHLDVTLIVLTGADQRRLDQRRADVFVDDALPRPARRENRARGDDDRNGVTQPLCARAAPEPDEPAQRPSDEHQSCRSRPRRRRRRAGELDSALSTVPLYARSMRITCGFCFTSRRRAPARGPRGSPFHSSHG